MSSDYHHGDLPQALRDAAVEVIAENGPARFSLREVARRAGVSHAAPAHHFGDAQGLLTSVATEGFHLVIEAMRQAAESGTGARDRLIACGHAYVGVALAHPGHYAVMIGHDYTDLDDAELLTASFNAYAQLLSAIEAIRDEFNPALDVDSTATLCWATMHGLVELASILDHVAETTDTALTSVDDLVVNFTDMLLEGIKA